MNTTLLPVSTDKAKSEGLLNLFHQHGEPKDYPSETVLFRQGQPIQEVCLIEQGIVKFTRTGGRGHEMVVALRLSGGLLGAAAVISKLAPQVTGKTLTESHIYCLSAETFQNLVYTRVWTNKGRPLGLPRGICQR